MVGVRLAGVAAVHPTQSALALGEEAVTVNAVGCRQHSNNSWGVFRIIYYVCRCYTVECCHLLNVLLYFGSLALSLQLQ